MKFKNEKTAHRYFNNAEIIFEIIFHYLHEKNGLLKYLVQVFSKYRSENNLLGH